MAASRTIRSTHLERLQELYAAGALSDEELAQEKARVLDDPGSSTS